MSNRIPTTLCWMYDIMYLMGTKYDPREIAQQERKIRKSIEEVIVQLTSDTSSIAVTQNGIAVDDGFVLIIAYNPSIYDQIVNFNISEQDHVPSSNEVEELTYKFNRLMPEISGHMKKQSIIQGGNCCFFLRGFCFITMQARLYELTERLLKVTNKDKMASVLNTVMTNLFPLISSRDQQFGECAADVLYSVLKTNDEYIAFRKRIVEIFHSDVSFNYL